VFVIDTCDPYIATGGVDNTVVIWNSQSGTIRTHFELPRPRPNTYVCNLKFVKSKQVFLFALQNSGKLHLINPMSETMQSDIMTLNFNAMMDFSPNLEVFVSLGESGKAKLF